MTDSEQLIDAFDARARRRGERRDFFKAALGAAAIGAGAVAFSNAASAQTVTDEDVLNFALNLEYLEANFYSYAVFGTGIDANGVAITGTGSAVTTGSLSLNAGAHAVPFSDPVVAAYAREITEDEIAHVKFLRSALGGSAVGQPQIDVGITPNGAFSSAARAAGLIGATTDAAPTFFDPYANDENFLLGAFIFEDVGVTAYKGASPLISNKTYLDAAAGILAAEAYHASIVRTVLNQKGIATPALMLREATEKISAARDSLDGTDDRDQGIMPTTTGAGLTANIAPTDSNAIAFSRNTGQVLNIVYLNQYQKMAGGFFPAGVNGNIKTSGGSVQPAA